jgi:hypothetical protein
MIGTIPTGFIGIGRMLDCCTFPLLVYITGISLVDLRMNIESNISTNTIATINNNTYIQLLPPDKLLYHFWNIPETIEAKINNEIPFETHFSVISSQSHISHTAPTVSTNATNNTVVISVDTALPPSIEFIKYVIQIHCKKAIGTVNNLVY